MNHIDKIFDENVIFESMFPKGIKGRLWCAYQALIGNVSSVMLFVPTKKWRKEKTNEK